MASARQETPVPPMRGHRGLKGHPRPNAPESSRPSADPPTPEIHACSCGPPFYWLLLDEIAVTALRDGTVLDRVQAACARMLVPLGELGR